MSRAKMNCTSCKFCDGFYDYEKDVTSYQCNRKPPVWTGASWEQPPVTEYDWCGEHSNWWVYNA